MRPKWVVRIRQRMLDVIIPRIGPDLDLGELFASSRDNETRLTCLYQVAIVVLGPTSLDDKMTRRLVLFGTLFFTGLVAGTAFVIWIEFDPSDLTGAYYTESMQHAIRVFTIPLPAIVVSSVVLNGVSSVLAWRERPIFYLLAASCLCMTVVALVTVLGNIPINNRIETWTPASPPSNWLEIATMWWRLQTIRTIAALGGFALVILAALMSSRKSIN